MQILTVRQSMAVAPLLAVAIAITSCATAHRSAEQGAYAPVFAQAKGGRPASARGTLKGDFDWAAASKTLAEAEARWREFLDKHRPPAGEYEDAFAARHVQAAEFELLRVEYLLGKRAEGDLILQRMDPLDIRDGPLP